MNSIDINNFRASAEVFLCASTPTYLYDNLKQLNEVEKLANDLSANDLYELCNQALAKDTKDWDDELAFYIPLIALFFKTYSEAHPYLLKLSKANKYKWTAYIVSLIIAGSKVITEYREESVENKPIIIFPEERLENPATSSNEFIICNEGRKDD